MCRNILFILIVSIILLPICYAPMTPSAPPPTPSTGSGDDSGMPDDSVIDDGSGGGNGLSEDGTSGDVSDEQDDESSIDETSSDTNSEIRLLRANIAELSLSLDTINLRIDEIESKLDEYIDNKPAPSTGIYTVFIIGFIVIIGLFVFLFFHIRKNSKHDGANKKDNSMSMDAVSNVHVDTNKLNKLRNYVSFNLRKGYSQDMLKQTLFKQGYRKEEIEIAFRSR